MQAETGDLSFSATAAWDEFVFALRTHLLTILLIAGSAVVGVYAALQFVTERYEAQASLLVKLGRENVELPATVDKGTVLSTGVRKEEVNSEIQMLASRDLVEAAIYAIGIEAFKFAPAPPTTFFQSVKFHVKAAVRWLRERWSEFLVFLNLKKKLAEEDQTILYVLDHLKVDREKDSDVIAVRIQLPDPELAVRFLDKLVALYLEHRVNIRRTPGVHSFFDEQTGLYQKRLSEMDRSREQVRTQRNISSLGDQRSLLLKRAHDLYEQIAANEKELRVLGRGGARPAAAAAPTERLPSPGSGVRAPGYTLRQLSTGLRMSDVIAAENADAPRTPRRESYPNFEALKQRVTELRMRRNELLTRYLPGAETVTNVDDEIAAMESMFRDALESLIADQRRQVAEIERTLGTLNRGEFELDALERERAMASQNYLAYAKRREEARISEELDLRRVSNIAVLSVPKLPIEPAYPRKLLIMGLAVPFGLLLGIGVALLLEYLNDKVRGPRDLRGLDGIAYLGTLRA